MVVNGDDLVYDKPEPIENLITWVYQGGSFVPSAKIVGNNKFSIINDYIGRQIQAYSEEGNLVLETDYDIYGDLRNLKGDRSFIPFRQLGQYEDQETGLVYNRFRYYDYESGIYLSKDPIGLLGGRRLYSYVHDSNYWIDIFGLTGTYMFTDGTSSYIGKGPSDRMYASMTERVGGKAKVTKGIHVDYGDNTKGLMVEAELMRRTDAIADADYKNAINSPGEKLLADAYKNDKALYNDIVKKADDFEAKFNKVKGIKCH
ncbi:RHS repeat-associated core domain-containing protein [Flavobacterium sp. MMLR14_040]|uniref:RHS repeat domain-containing protein n=1 Tax=Flavobacterium sp. MMLR14_040 TaxID=3093843 RepID=UPI0029902B6C|nr:RHS repeat-associated core domain-containing protein [Flavobacterium sp. MMLR14_040]MDW8852411.1 RHS repeat-associated core domain-containing protein [Flavobacterium sp. MMLR14_040]